MGSLEVYSIANEDKTFVWKQCDPFDEVVDNFKYCDREIATEVMILIAAVDIAANTVIGFIVGPCIVSLLLLRSCLLIFSGFKNRSHSRRGRSHPRNLEMVTNRMRRLTEKNWIDRRSEKIRKPVVIGNGRVWNIAKSVAPGQDWTGEAGSWMGLPELNQSRVRPKVCLETT